jgi:hypothetical protein
VFERGKASGKCTEGMQRVSNSKTRNFFVIIALPRRALCFPYKILSKKNPHEVQKSMFYVLEGDKAGGKRILMAIALPMATPDKILFGKQFCKYLRGVEGGEG